MCRALHLYLIINDTDWIEDCVCLHWKPLDAMLVLTINRAWNRSASFWLTQWLKIIPYMTVMFSHCAHVKLGHRFHALLKVRSDRDNIVPLTVRFMIIFLESREPKFTSGVPYLLIDIRGRLMHSVKIGFRHLVKFNYFVRPSIPSTYLSKILPATESMLL